MAIPYYWVDLALERLTLSYNEMLRGENTGRDRKKVKKLLYYISELSPKIDFENRGRDAPYETEDGCLSLLYSAFFFSFGIIIFSTIAATAAGTIPEPPKISWI